jgi:hypothetical protein
MTGNPSGSPQTAKARARPSDVVVVRGSATLGETGGVVTE